MRLQGRETIPLCCDDSEAGLGSLRLVEMMCPVWLVGGFGEEKRFAMEITESEARLTDSITDCRFLGHYSGFCSLSCCVGTQAMEDNQLGLRPMHSLAVCCLGC